MAVSDGFRDYAIEQLARVVPGGVRARRMFGGVGVYAGARFFALLSGDALYLKADDETRGAFEKAGMRPFLPGGDPAHPMRYYGIPAEMLEDLDALRPWVTLALGAAERKRRGTPRARGRRAP